MPISPREYQSGDRPPNGCVYGIQGRRPSMEDETFYATWRVDDSNPTIPASEQRVTVYGVLDGHGGATASKFVKRWLPWIMAHFIQPRRAESRIKQDIIECFLRMQNFMREYSDSKKGIFDHQGTTVSMFLWTHKFLFCANAGDSRSVWCRNGHAQPLSVDHKPTNPLERRRIEYLGGKVSGNSKADVARVEPVGLATSRSLGDLDSRRRLDGRELPRGTYLVSPVPDVVVVPQSYMGVNDFAILACDGVWDVMTNQQACNVVKKAGLADACKALVAAAYRAGSTDNITAMVVPMSSGVYYDPKIGMALINPLTQRPIKYMGPTHQKLIEEIKK